MPDFSPHLQDAKLPVSIGEWSLASNLDSPAFVNVSLPAVRDFLAVFFADQISMVVADDGVVGTYAQMHGHGMNTVF
jgi:hypothetical protein